MRAKSGRIIGALTGLFIVMKGLPLAYSKDMQEDKEGVFNALDSLSLCLAAMTGMMEKLTLCPSACWPPRAKDFPRRQIWPIGWCAKPSSVSRCSSHYRRAGGTGGKNGCDLADLTLADMQNVDARITDDVFSVLSVENSVASRTSFGGTAPENVRGGAKLARGAER